ncbi:AAA family ATPase [Methylocucumis oryzae]|uniref:AAA family ATPase n=1 Tax=Methylocucumis oryzae TaxID=1632867 RepID=UPI000A6C5A3C
MSLIKLDIHHVRNIQHITLTPCPGINIILGENASGKSSLLEAIFILGRAKSFRTPSIKSVIQQQHSQLIVTGQTQQPDGRIQHIGIQLDGKAIEIRINQQSGQTRSDLAYALPLQFIQPKSYELLDGSAKFRREFLDWGVFNDTPRFLPAWRNYKKALMQRNFLLKTKTYRAISGME